MPLPFSPNTTYVDDDLPAIAAKDLNDLQTYVAYLYNKRAGANFGTGADGTVTLSGAPPSWVTSGALNRDVHLANLTIPTGVTLDCGSFRLYVNNTLTIQGTGQIVANGNNASAATGGAGVAARTVSGRLSGPTSVSTAGVAGAAATSSYGGAGGGGGAGAAGAGGTAGGVTVPAASLGRLDTYSPPTFGSIIGGGTTTLATGGGSGGSSAGGTGSTGVGAGGAGGVLCVAARFIVLATATGFMSKGGNGANASVIVGTNCGGGGAGGGGLIVLVYETLTVTDNTTLSSALNCPGGTGGTATGTGSNGGAGSAGTYFPFPI